jgi:hypothetical protein
VRINRRDMLRILGAGALSAGVGRMFFRGSPARGQEQTIPKRIIFFYTQSGSMPGRWEPMAAAGSETDWDVNPDLNGELADYRADLNFFENLDMVSAFHDRTGPANSHYDGGTHAMTGAFRSSATEIGGPTIDQFIVEGLREQGVLTPFPSLELGYWFSHEGFVSSTGPAGRLPRMGNPIEVYDRLWPASEGSDEDAAREAAMRRRGAVFDLVRQRFNTLSPRLSGAERTKVEQHLASVDDLRRRLDLQASRTASRPPESVLDPMRNATSEPARYAAAIDTDIVLAAAALHSDLTRVITIEASDAPNEEMGYTPGQWGTSDAHDLIHKVMGDDPLSESADAIAAIRRQHLASTRRMRALLDELATRTEVDGSRLLDHTVVVFTSQIADGSHSLQGLPWFTAGSCGGALRTGRYFRQPRNMPQPGYRWVAGRWPNLGRAHNDLFVTLARAMGLDVDTFGAASVCTGPIPGMLA